MKILFLSTQSKESPSGGGRYWPLAKALVDLGHDVTLAALHHNYRDLINRNFTEDGVNVKYVGQMHVRKVGNQKLYFHPVQMVWIALIATLKLTWTALRTDCDAIHICKSQPMNGLAGWFAHLLRRVPVYLDSDDYESVNNRFSSPWQQKIVAWFENWLPSFVSGITVGTSFTRDHFISLGYPKERVFLVFNGVERKRFDILKRKDLANKIAAIRKEHHLTERRVVVYVGSISLTSHAIDVLFRAMVHVVEACEEVCLVLVGSGEDRDNLESLARDLGLGNHLKFLGRKPIEEIPLYFRIGELSVDPMHQSLQAESSLSLKLLESIAAGIPCVTADIGDRRQFVRDVGIAVNPDDPKALADGILSILSSPSLRQSMVDNTIQKQDNLFWDSRVESFVAVYNSDRIQV